MRWVTGIGDCLACAGAAVYLAWRYGKFMVPYEPQYVGYETSVRQIFASNPEVSVVPIEEAIEICQVLGSIPEWMELIIHYDDKERSTYGLDNYQWLYHAAGVPYHERWDSNPIPEAAKLVKQIPVPDEPYVFWHDDPSRGMLITRGTEDVGDLKIIKPDRSLGYPILAYKDLVENAVLGLFMNSSFFHLAEQSEPKGKLVLMHYARGMYLPWRDEFQTKHEWTIVR